MKLWLVFEEGYSDSDGAIHVDSVWESIEAAQHRALEDLQRVKESILKDSRDPTYKKHLPIGSWARTKFFEFRLSTLLPRLHIKEIETATRLDMDL